MAHRSSKTQRTRKGNPSQSAVQFAQLVNAHRTQGQATAPVTNFTFFLGAGFSKAWEAAYPLGKELFSIERANAQVDYALRAANLFPRLGPALDMDDFKQLVYSLDMNAKYPAIRSRYADAQNATLSKGHLSAYIADRLQRAVGTDWQWFDRQTGKFDAISRYSADQEKIQSLFSMMFPLVTGSHGFLEGARFNFITTNYDWLIERIIDSVCTEDDSALLYLYRGITPRRICGEPILSAPFAHAAFGHDLVFNLLKLNGGLEVYRAGSDYHLDYTLKTEHAYQNEAPILMLPSREQDYADAYFGAVFPKAVRLLHESKALVLVGYSLPDEDALLRFIIRQFCEDEADAPDKYLFYVDMADEAEQLRRVSTVFPFAARSLQTKAFSGSFATWAGDVATMLQ